MLVNSKRLAAIIFPLFMFCLMAQAQNSGGVIRRKTTTASPAKKKQPVRSTPQAKKKIAPTQPSAPSGRSRGKGRSGAAYSSTNNAERARVINNLINNMVYVQGGTFMMGATSEQGSDAESDEKPAHQVTLSGFYIGKYEVTQREWETIMGNNPSAFRGDNHPVENVSWDDCQEFIRKLNARTGRCFRLPTEAEWEFASRGGIKSRGYRYSGSHYLTNVAWYDVNSSEQTHDVGTRQPNELGIYDMSGNVCEWCFDWYGGYSSSSQTNPTGPLNGTGRVLRGGSWYFDFNCCRSSCRDGDDSDARHNDYGLRLVLSE